jgi:hypothetical protein
MANPSRRGQSGSEVSSQMQGADYTPFANTHFVLPYGLRFQQAVGQSTITNVVDAGATVVYTANNNFSAGHQVSIYGIDPVAYNLQNATILSATSTTFTITSAATGTYVSGGVVQKTGTTAVTIPAGITFVYAICVGGGGSSYESFAAGGAGGVAWGWTIASPSSFIGAGGPNTRGGYTRYGNIIAGGGGSYSDTPNGPGGGGGYSVGTTNYWGIPAGAAAGNAGSSGSISTAGNGGSGISGGGGGYATLSGSQTNTGGNGGSGLIGGGGGSATGTTGTRIGGSGGNGINILTGVATTGGTGTTGTNTNGAGGGGAGIAGNGSNASGVTGGNGGLGGGAGGSAGIGGGSTTGGVGLIYLFY